MEKSLVKRAAAIAAAVVVFGALAAALLIKINIKLNTRVSPFVQQYEGIQWQRYDYDDAFTNRATITLDGEKNQIAGFHGRLTVSCQGRDLIDLEECIILRSKYFSPGVYFICDLNKETRHSYDIKDAIDDMYEIDVIVESEGFMLANDDWSEVSIHQWKPKNDDFSLFEFIWTAPAEQKEDAIEVIRRLSVGTAFASDTWE